MVLQTKSNQSLYYLLIAYAFFAFLMPLSAGISVILCILSFLAVVFLNDSDLLCFLAFSVCFAGGSGLTALFLSIYDVVLALIIVKNLILSIKHKDKKSIKFICAMLCLMAILTLYGLILTKFHFYKLGQSLGLILTIAAVYLVKKVDFKKLIFILSLGLISSTILSLIAYFCGISVLSPFIKDATSKYRFGAYFEYVNAFAFYCSLAQTCILALFLNKTINTKKWWALLVAVTLLGLSSFSKSFILVTIISYGIAILLGFIQTNNKKRYIKFCAIGLLVISLVCLCCYKYIITIIQRFSAHTNYGGGALNIATTGRIGIWKTYLEYWTSSIWYVLFGCGITANKVGEYTPHNFFISMLYRFGIVGILILICFIIWIIKQYKATKNINWYLPLFIVLLNAFFEDISSSLFTCLPLLITMLMVLKTKNIHIDNKQDLTEDK